MAVLTSPLLYIPIWVQSNLSLYFYIISNSVYKVCKSAYSKINSLFPIRWESWQQNCSDDSCMQLGFRFVFTCDYNGLARFHWFAQVLDEENSRMQRELVQVSAVQQKEDRLKALQQQFSAKINELYVMNDSLAELLQSSKWCHYLVSSFLILYNPSSSILWLHYREKSFVIMNVVYNFLLV